MVKTPELMGRNDIRDAEEKSLVELTRRMEMVLAGSLLEPRRTQVVLGDSVAREHRIVVGRMILGVRKTKTEQRIKEVKLKQDCCEGRAEKGGQEELQSSSCGQGGNLFWKEG